MSRWWRAYDGAIEDAKLLLLPSDRHRWGWFCLMCLASANGGALPDIKVVAVKLRMTTVKAAELIASLVRAGLVDESEAGFAPHNWNARQYRSDVTDPTNAVRQKRFRNAHRNAVTTVTVKRPETEVQSTETERKKDAADAAPTSEEADYFRRGKQILGPNAGGLLAQLKAAKTGSVALARAAIEQATTKQNPREYLMRVIRGQATTEAEQNKKIEEVMRQKGSAVVFADEIPGGIPGIT